jgi:hypothetical protein
VASWWGDAAQFDAYAQRRRRDYWWPEMSCLLDAFSDHGAADLFT